MPRLSGTTWSSLRRAARVVVRAGLWRVTLLSTKAGTPRQTQGYEVGSGQYIIIDPDEVAAAIPATDRTLEIYAFDPCGAGAD